ncbi:hypothetical protein C8J57DRAFT_1243344 [Mycena rebaudengoi]|nr:hypothetical protein C8J57DRAFT_1243344 [Mycena rebaudengoi]
MAKFSTKAIATGTYYPPSCLANINLINMLQREVAFILRFLPSVAATPSPVLRRGARERRAPLPPDKTPPAPAPVPAPRRRRGRQPDAVPDAPPVPVDPIPERRDEAGI